MSNKKLIWIVDNELGVRMSITSALSGGNYDCRLFLSADEAVNALEGLGNSGEATPVLIITDYDTKSAMNGLAVVEKAREMNIPAIMQSATPDIENQAKLSGVKGFLAKPWELGDLLAMVQRVISESERSGPAKGGMEI